MKYQKNDRVIVTSSCNSKGESGTVKGYCNYGIGYSCKYVQVKLDNGTYNNYNENSIKKTNNKENEVYKMVGEFKIAVVVLNDDYNKKEYGFALFDKAEIDDFVVVNPKNTYSLGTVKKILTQEEYGKGVQKEVIGVVSQKSYKLRLAEREMVAKINKERKELQLELDRKISKLKDIEYYERMATELGDKDPEIAKLANKLKSLTV